MNPMIANVSPADSLVGVPRPVNDRGSTSRITDIDTGPPRSQAQALPPGTPATWQQGIIDAGGQALLAGMKQLVAEARAEGGNKGPPGRMTAVLALVLSITANVGLVVAIALHSLGNAAFEHEFRAELEAQRRALYGLIDVLAKDRPEVRTVERDLQR